MVLPDCYQLHSWDLDVEAPAELDVGVGLMKVIMIRMKLVVKPVSLIKFSRERACVDQVSGCFHGVGGEDLPFASCFRVLNLLHLLNIQSFSRSMLHVHSQLPPDHEGPEVPLNRNGSFRIHIPFRRGYIHD